MPRLRKGMLLAVLIGVAAPLVAPPPPAAEAQRKRKKKKKKEDPQSKIRKEADRHFRNGVRLFSENKYAEALAEFEQAYALEPHPLVLYNLAGAHRALSQYSQAVDFYNRFLLEGEGNVRDEQLERGRAELAALLELVAKVEVNTRPQGARVSVDGREIGETPLGSDVILGPGDHTVEAVLEGYQPLTRRFRVAAGDELTLDLELESLAAAAEAAAAAKEEATLPPPAPRPRRASVSAAMGTNALEISRTGAPVVGVGYSFTDRLSLGVDVVLIAYAAVPAVRYRLFGDAFSVHGIAAVPVSFGNGEGTFATGAAGLGLRYRPAEVLALRLETWVSYGGAERGTTLPTFAAAELWF